MTTAPTILTHTRVIKDADGPPKIGANYRTRYIWRGPAGDPVFAIRDSRDVEFERIDVVCETPCEAVAVIERTKNQPGTIPSTNNSFRRWRIYGNGLAQRGFWCRATIDANNEHMEFHANTVYGVALPFVFEGQQSKHHCLTHNVIETFDVAVTSDTAFRYSGGTIAVGRVAFTLARVGDPVTIENVGVEACGRLLITSGPTTDAQSVKLDQVRFSSDQLHPDRGAIVQRHAGCVTVSGGLYGDGDQPIPQIHLAGVGEQALSIADAKFGAFDADTTNLVVCNPGVRETITAGLCTYQRGRYADERTTNRTSVLVHHRA